MTKNLLVEAAYPRAQKAEVSARRAPRRLSPATALITIVLLSLGFWWAIWTAVAALVSD
jgi:hypothetical protein